MDILNPSVLHLLAQRWGSEYTWKDWSPHRHRILDQNSDRIQQSQGESGKPDQTRPDQTRLIERSSSSKFPLKSPECLWHHLKIEIWENPGYDTAWLAAREVWRVTKVFTWGSPWPLSVSFLICRKRISQPSTHRMSTAVEVKFSLLEPGMVRGGWIWMWPGW